MDRRHRRSRERNKGCAHLFSCELLCAMQLKRRCQWMRPGKNSIAASVLHMARAQVQAWQCDSSSDVTTLCSPHLQSSKKRTTGRVHRGSALLRTKPCYGMFDLPSRESLPVCCLPWHVHVPAFQSAQPASIDQRVLCCRCTRTSGWLLRSAEAGAEERSQEREKSTAGSM